MAKERLSISFFKSMILRALRIFRKLLKTFWAALSKSKSERSENTDARNGYKSKQVNSSYGSFNIDVPQDRDSTFEPQVVKKRQKDISDIDSKIISMYAKGMTTKQISDTLRDIYGFEVSEGFISNVTDKILPEIEEWQNRH